jgi:hypothetical protein
MPAHGHRQVATFTAAPGLPATVAFAITPNDAADIPTVTLALNVATRGVVRVTPLAGGTADVFIDAGHLRPVLRGQGDITILIGSP